MDDQAPITWDDVKDSKPDPNFVYFSPEGQTIDALELTLEHLRRTLDRPMSWKSVLLGIHAAVHGSLVLAVEGTDGAAVLTPEHEQQYRQHVDRERANQAPENLEFTKKRKGEQVPTRSQVDWFDALYTKARDPGRMIHFSGRALPTNAERDRQIERLHDLRGRFIHFSSGGHIIEIALILEVVIAGLDVIDFLLQQAQPFPTITDHEAADRARQLIDKLRVELQAMWERYGLTLPN
jgi:hypothetical protein